MTDKRKLLSIAEQLILAHTAGPLSVVADNGPVSAAEAYEVQAVVAERLGPVGGFKAGRKHVGETLTKAPISCAKIWSSGGSITAENSHLLGVELEIGFLFLTDPPDPDAPDFLSLLHAAVAVLPVLEIVESRLADIGAAGPLWKLADSQINGGLVFGKPVFGWDICDLSHPGTKLRIGNHDVWAGQAPMSLSDAFAILAALVADVGSHCGGLKSGHFVITGSLAGLHHACSGQQVYGDIAGLGGVSTHFN